MNNCRPASCQFQHKVHQICRTNSQLDFLCLTDVNYSKFDPEIKDWLYERHPYGVFHVWIALVRDTSHKEVSFTAFIIICKTVGYDELVVNEKYYGGNYNEIIIWTIWWYISKRKWLFNSEPHMFFKWRTYVGIYGKRYLQYLLEFHRLTYINLLTNGVA